MIGDTEGWEEPRKILVILAHPDDPEFFCGATIAKWTEAGHDVSYCILTRGDKGTKDRELLPEQLVLMREIEQMDAAKELGVKTVHFLDYPDGYLVHDLDIRREVVRIVRRERPDVIVTSDPTNYFPSDIYLNHPDHRAAGDIVISAIFPGAGNHLYFPELLKTDGLETHQVKEVWISLTHQPNLIMDVTDIWDRKLSALYKHVSQIGDPVKFEERMRNRHTLDSTRENPRYEEKFRRIILG